MITKVFNNSKLINILFVISTLLLIGFIIYVLIEHKHFTAFHPVNIIWYVFLMLKLRLNRLTRINRQKERMFKSMWLGKTDLFYWSVTIWGCVYKPTPYFIFISYWL